MKSRNGGAPKSSIKDNFITSTINTFRKKPVVIHKNTAIFSFETHENKEIWLSIEKNLNEYCYSWIEDTDNGMERISIDLPSKTPLYRDNSKRNTTLIKKLTSKYKFPKEDLVTFLEELGLYLKDKEAEIFKENEDSQETEEDKPSKNLYNCFEDYPEHIKREALEIIEYDPLKFFLDTIELTHKGDTKAKKLILLSVASLFVSNSDPVHQGFKGVTGVGKTSVTKKTLKIVPSRYIQEIRESSPKYAYYAGNTFNPDFNIFLFDDIVLSDAMIEMAKTITDNETKEKTHKTLIDQKPVELKMPGKTLGFITVAKDILNNELDRRLMYNNPKEDEDHTQAVKQMIKRKTKIGLDVNDEVIIQLYLIANAIFEKLIETSIKVYNPYLEHIDLEDKNYTDIQHFMNLVKAVTYYYQFKRQKIENVVIGTLKDLEFAIELWDSISILQEYKIDSKHIALLKLLKPFDHELHEILKESWGSDKTDFKESVNYTYKYLGRTLGLSTERIKQMIRGVKGSDKRGLEDLGLVLDKQLDPDNRTSPYVVYFNPAKSKVFKDLHMEETKDDENALKCDLPLQILTKNDICKGFSSLEDKRSILNDILLLTNKFKIRGIYTHITKFLEKHPQPLKSDENIYNFINSFLEHLKDQKIKKEDIKELSYNDLHMYISSLYQGSIGSIQQQDKKALNPEITIKPDTNRKLSKHLQDEKTKEDLKTNIPKNLVDVTFDILKSHRDCINKFDFRSDLMEKFQLENNIDALNFETLLLKKKYIKFDGKINIYPTNKLLTKST